MAEDNSVVEWNLQLSEENVLHSLLKAFSYPDVITYEGAGYNLTKAYDTFWSQFYDSPVCSDKYRKLPELSLGNKKLKSLAKIIKRGWLDERYLPTKFPETFLKCCFFGKQSLKDISSETILEFIKDNKEVEVFKKLLDDKTHHLRDESIKDFKKYSPNASISTSDLVEEACVVVVKNIFDEFKVIIQEWSKELDGLLDLKEFDFVMKRRKACLSREPFIKDYDDLTDLEEDLPHKLWTMFFQGMDDDQIDFYFQMLCRNDVTCACGAFGSKHLMGNDFSNCLSNMNTKRHDLVLEDILEKLKEAQGKEGTFFASANDWVSLRRLHSLNETYTWPKELNMLAEDKTPHLLVYSMKPKKKIMIVEASVMWEEWYKLPPDKRKYKTKTKEFRSTVEKLEKNGFEVEFRDIEMGCRGILCRKLYNLFKEDFKMEHGEVSKSMEKISKMIVLLPFLSNKIKKKPSKTSLKRKCPG